MKSSALYVKPFFAVVTTMTILILFQFSAAKAFAGGENEFIKLVKSGTPDQIQAAVDKGASLGVRDKNNDDAPPLCDAAQYNTNPEVISVLLKAGENLNDVDDTDSTALSCAAYANPNPDMISALIAAGAEVDRQSSKDGYTALMNAAQYNPKPEVITALLNAGANVNLRANSGYTPLMCAANNNQNPVVINILANHGGDVNAHEDHGFTPLIIAATVNRNPEIISALLRAGANINAQDNGGYSALIMAVWKNPNDEVISVLLDAGADVMMKSGVGTTALAYANPALQKTDVYQKLAVATQVAAAQGGGSSTQTAQAQAPAQASTQTAQAPRMSPDEFFDLVYKGTPQEVEQAIQNGVDVNAPNKDGNLPLSWAASNPNAGVVTALIQAGANINAKNYRGTTALMAAASGGTPEVVSILLQAGADANVQDNIGDTAVSEAYQNWALKQSPVYQQLLAATQGGQQIAADTNAAQAADQERTAEWYKEHGLDWARGSSDTGDNDGATSTSQESTSNSSLKSALVGTIIIRNNSDHMTEIAIVNKDEPSYGFGGKVLNSGETWSGPVKPGTYYMHATNSGNLPDLTELVTLGVGKTIEWTIVNEK